jgi:hypothetical protein
MGGMAQPGDVVIDLRIGLPAPAPPEKGPHCGAFRDSGWGSCWKSGRWHRHGLAVAVGSEAFAERRSSSAPSPSLFLRTNTLRGE